MKITIAVEFTSAEDAVAFIRQAQPTGLNIPTIPVDSVGVTGPVAPPVKRTRKKAETEPLVTVAPSEQAIATEKKPTVEEVQAATERVYEKYGIERTVDMLARFGVRKTSALKPEQYSEFVSYAQEVIAGKDPAAVSEGA